MSSYNYYLMDLNDGLYMEPMMICLGEALEYFTNDLSMLGQEALERFVASGIAEEFERQNPVYVLGKSGIELADCILEYTGKLTSKGQVTECANGGDASDEDACSSDSRGRDSRGRDASGGDIRTTPTPNSCAADKDAAVARSGATVHDAERIWASWIGEMIAYYQAASGCSYERIIEALPYPRLVELAIVYASEATPETFAEILDERIAEAPRTSRLRTRRIAAGLSQAQLAKRAGVSLRALQQYEQGSKNINHAQAAALYRIARVLGCTIENLLESPVI